MPVYSTTSAKQTVEAIVTDQLEDAVDTTISGLLTVDTLACESAATFNTISAASTSTFQTGARIGTTSDTGQSITWYGSSGGTPSLVNNIGDITLKTSTLGKKVSLESGTGNKLAIGNSAGCVLTNSSLIIPGGAGNTTGGIVIKGNSADSSIFTTAAGNTLNVSAGTASAIQLCQNSVSKWALGADGITVYTPQNLTFSGTTADKIISFANTSGNATIMSDNPSGTLITSVPTAAKHDWQINSSTLMSLETPSAGTLGLSMTNCPINLSAGTNNGLVIKGTSLNSTFSTQTGNDLFIDTPSSLNLALAGTNKVYLDTDGLNFSNCPITLSGGSGNGLNIETQFQLVRPTASNDIYFASNHATGELVFQSNSTTQFEVGPTYVNIVKALKYTPTNVSAAYTLLSTDSFLVVNSVAASRTITLPASSGAFANNVVVIVRRGGNSVSLSCSGCTINGLGSLSVSADYASLKIYGDGTNWISF